MGSPMVRSVGEVIAFKRCSLNCCPGQESARGMCVGEYVCVRERVV